MSLVFADISMSLDGRVAGPDDSPARGLGVGGERLHAWIYGLATWRARHGLAGGETGRDAEILEENFANTGSVVMGRRMFDAGEGPWGDTPPFAVPVFVLTHRPRAALAKNGGTTFAFVTSGIEDALARARAAAGGRDVWVAGGAQAIRQSLQAGLLDELRIHLVPVVLGGGVRLFGDGGLDAVRLEPARVVASPAVTHLTYRVVG